MAAEQAHQPGTRDERLDRSGEGEAEHKGPECLPEHEEALAQGMPEVDQDVHWPRLELEPRRSVRRRAGLTLAITSTDARHSSSARLTLTVSRAHRGLR